MLVLCVVFATPKSAQSTVADHGLICIDETSYSYEWTTDDIPVKSVVAHWFDNQRVFTTNWARENDHIVEKSSKYGKRYSTDTGFIRWQLDFFDDEEKIVEINRADGSRSIKSADEIIITVKCDLFDDQKMFDDKVSQITEKLQTRYDSAIADHKL